MTDSSDNCESKIASTELGDLLLRVRRREAAKVLVRRACEIERQKQDSAAQRRRMLRSVAASYLNCGCDSEILAMYRTHRNDLPSFVKSLPDSQIAKLIDVPLNGTNNPYLDIFNQITPMDEELRVFVREILVDKYAWAIPNEEALVTIARYAPIVEIGAGTGYWAALLRTRGIDIVAVDVTPVESGLNDSYTSATMSFTDIVVADESLLTEHRDRTLLISWPPDFSSMPCDALSHYKGEYFIYIGESDNSGQEQLHRLLEERWKLIDSADIPQWQGMHDWLQVYQRKAMV